MHVITTRFEVTLELVISALSDPADIALYLTAWVLHFFGHVRIKLGGCASVSPLLFQHHTIPHV